MGKACLRPIPISDPTKRPLMAANDRIVPTCILSQASTLRGASMLASPKFVPFVIPNTRIRISRHQSSANNSGAFSEDNSIRGTNTIPLTTVAVRNVRLVTDKSTCNIRGSMRPIVSAIE